MSPLISVLSMVIMGTWYISGINKSFEDRFKRYDEILMQQAQDAKDFKSSIGSDLKEIKASIRALELDAAKRR